MQNKKLLVHLHLYYHEQIDFMIKNLKNINGCNWDLFVTYNTENPISINKLLKLKSDVHLIKVDNIGYDVWPFIQVIKSVNLNDYAYILKIHTKNKTPMMYVKKFTAKGYWWRNELINVLLSSKRKFRNNLKILDNNRNIGMLCSEICLFDTGDGLPENTYMLDDELKLLNFKTKSGKFCAGTMFMAKTEIYKFLKQDIINKLRFEPSEGSSSNTSLAHTYERILTIAAIESGYKIKTIPNYKENIYKFFKTLFKSIFSIHNSDKKNKNKKINKLGFNIYI